MPPKTRREWRKKFQQGDEHHNEDVDGSNYHHGPSENLNGISHDSNRSGSASNEGDHTLVLREHAVGGQESISHSLKKRTRGATYMKHIWGMPRGHKRIKVESNEYGQPIGATRSQFVEFLGTVARNGFYAPIDVKSWPKMPEGKKNEMLDLVKKKFELPPGMEYWILQKLGNRWKSWKSQLKKKYFKANVPIEFQREVDDDRVMQDQWTNLMAYWGTDKAKLMSNRNKEVRGHKTMHHRTGKTSFAHIANELKSEIGHNPSRAHMFKECFTDKAGNANCDEVTVTIAEMDKKTSELPSGSSDEPSRSDVFAQVRGEERNGRARMMGSGVAPSDLSHGLPTRNSSYRMALEQKSAFDKMQVKHNEDVEQLKSHIRELQTLVKQQMGTGLLASSATACQVGSSTRLRAGTYVDMISVSDASTIVAKGRLQSLDPSDVVGGRVLGANWCEVLVQVVVEPVEMLIRPYDMFDRISDVLGCSVAWPVRLVIPTDD